MSSLSADQRESLSRFLRQHFSEIENLQLSAVSPLGAGWETDLFALRISGDQNGQPIERDLVLRLYKGEDPKAKAAKEYSLMKAVPGFGVSAPRLEAFVTDTSILGAPFISMEHLGGGTLDAAMASNGPTQWLDSMMETFARIHSLPWNQLLPAPVAPLPNPTDPLRFITELLQTMDQAVERYELADFERTMSWLHGRSEMGATVEASLIHNDYHPQNILMRGSQLVIIDWSFAEVSDYRLDLAWSSLLTDLMIDGVRREEIVECYERASGSPVANLEYFEALKFTMRMLTIATWLDESVEIPVAGITRQAIRGDYKVHVLNPYQRLKQITGQQIETIEQL